MLQRRYRLTKKSDFQKVLKQGQKAPGRFFTLFFVNSEITDNSKMGIIVSNKVSKSSVVRNRIRRHTRESLRPEVEFLNKGFNLVFLSKKAATEATGDLISKDVKILLKRANLYQKGTKV